MQLQLQARRTNLTLVWSCRRVGTRHDEGAGGGAQRYFFLRERLQHPAAELAQNTVALVGPDPHVEQVIDLVAVDLVDTEHIRLVNDDLFESFIVPHAVGKSFEDGYHAIGIDPGVYTDIKGSNGEVAGKVGDGRDLAVGHDIDSAVAVAQCGAAERQVFHRTLHAGDFDGVADVVLVFEEDKDAVEHVLEDGLRTEADAEADNARGSDKGAERDADSTQQLHRNVGEDEGVGAGADDAGRGAKLGGALGVSDQAVGPALHALDEEKRYPLQDEGDEQGNDDLGQTVLEKGNEVGVPAVLERTKCVLVLWDVVGKLHDDGVPGLWH